MNGKLRFLFEQLSIRLRNENDLSDITWAIMNTISGFQELFLEYCFDRKLIVLETEREYAITDSRPDFFFYDIENNKFIIEVKINDRNMHFDQYCKNEFFSNCEKSFISNYIWHEENGWYIKTWTGFLKFLKDYKWKFDQCDSDIIECYIAYLESTIWYEETKSMDISKLESIRSFYVMIEDVISNYNKVELFDYNSSKPCTPEKYGKFIYFKINKSDVYLWIGLYFTAITGVYVEFEYMNEWWVPKKYSDILKRVNEGVFFEKPTFDGKYLWIRLKENLYKKLCDEKILVQDQKEILNGFLNEIIEIFKNA